MIQQYYTFIMDFKYGHWDSKSVFTLDDLGLIGDFLCVMSTKIYIAAFNGEYFNRWILNKLEIFYSIFVYAEPLFYSLFIITYKHYPFNHAKLLPFRVKILFPNLPFNFIVLYCKLLQMCDCRGFKLVFVSYQALVFSCRKFDF